MSHISTNSTFLLHLSTDKINSTLVSLLEQGVDFELLDPRDLAKNFTLITSKPDLRIDQKWNSVVFCQDKVDEDLEQKMLLLGKILQKYSNSIDFVDQKCIGSITKKLENWKEVYLLDIIHKLSKNSLVYHKDLVKRGVLKANKIGKILEVGEKLVIIDDLKALYTKYEIQRKANQLQAQFFKLNETTDAVFSFVSLPEYLEPMAIGIFTFLQVDYDLVIWNQPVVDWSDKGFYGGYQKIIMQSQPNFGLNPELNSNLVDPIKFFATFSIFFTSLLISDIWVGLVVLIVSGIASLFQKKLLLQNNLIYTQVLVGLLSSIFGVILGRFGGNLLALGHSFSTIDRVSSVVSSIQLVGLYEVKNKAILPINSLMASNGLSLDFLLLVGFGAVALGFLVLSYLVEICKKYFNPHFKLNKSNNPELRSKLSNTLSKILASIFRIKTWVSLLRFLFQFVLQFVIQFSQLFGLLIVPLGYEMATSFLNNLLSNFFRNGQNINQNVFGLVELVGFVVLHFLLALVLWQISFKLTNKVFCDCFLRLFDNSTDSSLANFRGKIFKSTAKYKWWQF